MKHNSRALKIGRKLRKYGPKYLIMIIISLIMIGPLYWMVSTSLKEFANVFLYPPQIFPNPIAWSNFADLFSQQPFHLYMFNSYYVAAVVCIGTVLFASIAGYAFAKLSFKGRNMIFLLILSGMMMPLEITSIPLFIAFSKIGLVDNFFPLTVPQIFGFGGAFGVFLMRQFFITIPCELDDAARIDGCNPWRAFWNIMFPMAKGVTATLVIFTFVNNVNELFLPLIYLSSSRRFTITLAISLFTSDIGVQWHLIMAASVVATIPSLIVFFIGQKKFIDSMAMSGIK